MTRGPATDLGTRLLLSLAVAGVVGTALGGCFYAITRDAAGNASGPSAVASARAK